MIDEHLFRIRRTLMAAAIAAATCDAAPAIAQTSPSASAVELRVATGMAGKGFSRVFADMRSVCGGAAQMVEVPTEGGLQNLTVLAANKADIGFVQLDTLQTMQDSDPSIAALQLVMPMNSNLLHVTEPACRLEGRRHDADEPAGAAAPAARCRCAATKTCVACASPRWARPS